MGDLKLAQNFALIALNAQRSLSMTTAKKVALRCIAAAVILEIYLDGGFAANANKLTLKENGHGASSTGLFYRDTILKALQSKQRKGNLAWWLERASALSTRKLEKFERLMADYLKGLNLLEEIPHLLGCDFYFYSAGVEIKEYRSNIQEYSGITENMRADILEDGPVTDETVCLLWLLRESGSLHDFFSQNELNRVTAKMIELYRSLPLARELYPIRIHRGLELGIRQFLRLKKRAVKTPVGSGLNFLFPVIERSKSVFIDTEAMFSNADNRLSDVRARVESHGHVCQVLQEGEIPLLKIDNLYYAAVPYAIYGKIPIHGVRLLPKHPI